MNENQTDFLLSLCFPLLSMCLFCKKHVLVSPFPRSYSYLRKTKERTSHNFLDSLRAWNSPGSRGGAQAVWGKQLPSYEAGYHSLIFFSRILIFLTQGLWYKLVMSGLCHWNLAKLNSLPPPFVLRLGRALHLQPQDITFPAPIPGRLGSFWPVRCSRP